MSTRAIQAVKVTTRDEYPENTAIGLYRVGNVASMPDAADLEYYYRLNDGTGTSADDESGNNNDGTVTSASWVDSRRGRGKCLEFDGSSGDLQTASLSNFDSYTLAAWVYIDSDGESDAGRIFTLGTSGLDLLHTIDESGGLVRISFKADFGAGTDCTAQTAVDVSVDAWHHVAVSFDGTDALIYVDGADSTDSAVSGVGTHTSTAGAHYIGNDSADAKTFDGKIDDAAFWGGNALTLSEITTVYNLESAPSVFRWIETTPQNVTTDTWLSGFIMQEGIAGISAKGDLRLYGGRAKRGGTNLSVDDTALLWSTLDDAENFLKGCKAEVYEFADDGADPNGTRLFTGKIDNIQYNETDYSISIKNGYDNRSAIITSIDDEKTIPVTFGFDDKQKMIKTTNTEDQLSVDDIPNIGTVDPTGTTLFYVKAVVDSVTYDIQFANSFGSTGGMPAANYLTGKFIKVVEGDNSGTYRQITSVPLGSTAGWFRVTFDKVFETNLAVNDWVSMYTAEQVYKFDNWPCETFTDDAGNAIDRLPTIYTYDNDIYNRLPDFAVDVDDSDTDNNELIVEPVYYDGSLNSALSFLIEKPNPQKITNMSKYGVTYTSLSSGSGWFYDPAETTAGSVYTATVSETGNIGNTTDNSSTSAFASEINIAFRFSGSSKKMLSTFCFEIDTPSPPENFSFNEVYLILNAKDEFAVDRGGDAVTRNNISLGEFYVRTRRFNNATIDVVSFTGYKTWTSPTSISTGTLSMFPDRYWDSTVDSEDTNFYQKVSNATNIKGYTSIPIDNADTLEKYNGLKNIGVQFSKYYNLIPVVGGDFDGSITHKITIYEIGVLFKGSSDIGDSIYVPAKGRIYDNTWGSRKTATTMINNPVDVIEHSARLQNWADEQLEQDAGWGLEYADNALIDTSTNEGGFDYPELATFKNMRYARQLFSNNDAKTDRIIDETCKTFGLVQYQDSDGNEAINTMVTVGGTLDTIAYADVIENSDVVEPNSSDIFAEPVVNYNYDAGSGEYLDSISITNVDAAAYDSSFVVGGYNATEAEEVWNLCQTLFDKCKVINVPPDDWSNLKGVYRQEDAETILRNRIEWMFNKRIAITVSYSTGRDYEIFQHIKLQFPHLTNNQEVECMIEGITKDKNKNRVQMNLVFLDNIPTIAGIVQDTYGDSELDYWQDAYSSSGANDVNDNYN